jgi:3-oxoadipate enol-lactonase
MPFTRINDIGIHYRWDGPEDAPVLVLANSIATDLTLWDAVVAGLTRSFRVLRYDTRGHGKSEVTKGPYTLDLLGRDLLGLLDGLQLSKVDLCGLSLGAMTGAWLAAHHGERIGKLVLCNTAAWLGPAEAWETRIAAARDHGMEVMRPAVLGRWLSPAFCAANEAKVERLLDMVMATPLEGYLGACAVLQHVDLRETIRSIAVPTLVVCGAEDAATPPSEARFIADRIPRATCLELPGGHQSNVEQPERLAAVLKAFLQS